MEFQELSAAAKTMFDDSIRTTFNNTFKPNNQSFDAERLLKRLQGRFNEWRDPNRTLDEYYFASDSNVVLYRSNRKTKERLKVRICVPLELRVDVLVAEHIKHHGNPFAERIARKYKGITLQQAQWVARHCTKCSNTSVVRGLTLKEAGVHLMRKGPARVAEQVQLEPEAEEEGDTIHTARVPDGNQDEDEETEDEEMVDDSNVSSNHVDGSSIIEQQPADMGFQGAAQWGSLRPQFQAHQPHTIRPFPAPLPQPQPQEARQFQAPQPQPPVRKVQERQPREVKAVQRAQVPEPQEDREIERLVAHRNVLSNGKIITEYRARWKGLPEEHDKWYKKQDLDAAPLLVQEYDILYLAEQKRVARSRASLGSGDVSP